jgi:uncharacterized protein (UPF0548 family)
MLGVKMLRWGRPTDETLQSFIDEAQRTSFSYGEVGETRALATGTFTPPVSYDWDRRQTHLGNGDAVFEAAADAIARGRMFDIAWLQARFPARPVAADDVVAVAAGLGPCWWLNAARVVYLIDETDAGVRRRGFAYGTLALHGEAGEERFAVEQRADGSVWFDLAAFSRPRHLLLRAGYPFMRGLQARFRRDSAAALQRAVAKR